jgi:hypothetical protein
LAVMLCLSKSTAELAVSWFKHIFALINFPTHLQFGCLLHSKACGL